MIEVREFLNFLVKWMLHRIHNEKFERIVFLFFWGFFEFEFFKVDFAKILA